MLGCDSEEGNNKIAYPDDEGRVTAVEYCQFFDKDKRAHWEIMRQAQAEKQMNKMKNIIGNDFFNKIKKEIIEEFKAEYRNELWCEVQDEAYSYNLIKNSNHSSSSKPRAPLTEKHSLGNY